MFNCPNFIPYFCLSHQQGIRLPEPGLPRTPAFTNTANSQSRRVRPLQAEQQGLQGELLNGFTAAELSNVSPRRPNEVVTSHDHPTPRNRSRFPSLSTTTSSTTPTSLSSSTTGFGSIGDSNERFTNRGRLIHTPRFINRGQNVSVRVHKRPQQPQEQPTIADESKELADAPNETEEAPRPRRINITHNGSSNNKISSESTEDAENRYSDEIEPSHVGKNNIDTDEKLVNQPNTKVKMENSSINPVDSTNYEDEREEKIQVVRKEPTENDAIEDEEDIDGVEDADDEPATTLPSIVKNATDNETTKLSDGTVILTSNFFLPGKHDAAEGASDEVEDEDEEIEGDDEMIEQNTKSEDVATTSKQSTLAASLPTTSTAGSPSTSTKGATSTTTTDGSLIEYEYEYEDYVDEITTIANEPADPSIGSNTSSQKYGTISANASASNETSDPLRKEIVSVVTTKSVVNGSTSNPTPIEGTKYYDKSNISSTEPGDVDDDAGANTTESWVVVASVQTSRSISGARFLPFPQVEQEEKKQILSDLDKEEEEADERYDDDDETIDEAALKDDAKLVTTPKPEDTTISSVENTTHVSTVHFNQDQNGSILKKIHEKLLHENVELTTKGIPVFIRKFSPKTTTARPPFGSSSQRIDTQKKANTDSLPQDDLSGLLPPGFKFRPTGSYKNRKITTTTEKPSEDIESSSPAKPSQQEVRIRNETDSRSYKNKVNAQDVASSGLLPKDYKMNLTDKLKSGDNNESRNETPKVSDLLSKIKFDDNIEQLLPKDYPKETTKAPLGISTVTDDISKFLPPGFKVRKDEPKRPASNADDVSKFLPPGFKLPKDADSAPTRTTPKPRLSTFTIADDISKFLPPNLKSPATESQPKVTGTDDISKFLPPGFKLNADKDKTSNNNSVDANDILNKLKFKTDISDLLPPGFKAPEETSTKSSATPIEDGGASNFKVVFPKGINKRPGNRVTTPRPALIEGPAPPVIQIRKGLPTR